MKVLLLNPPASEQSWYRAEHLGIAYLGAVLREAKHQVHLLDANLEEMDAQQTAQAILQRSPELELLGITATEPESLKAGIQVVRSLHQAGLHPHVTTGGYLPTFWSDAVLNKYAEIDTVVVGEGEETLKELVDTLKRGGNLAKVAGIVYRSLTGEILHTPSRHLIQNLDQLPFPARDYLTVSYQKYHHALVYSSRGCYHKCSFCQIAQFYRLTSGGPYRTRSAKNIANEVELLVNQMGVRSIFFVDDEFITESKRRHQVIQELIQEIHNRQIKISFSIQYRVDTGSDEALLTALKEVGLRTVFIGVESGVERVLQRFDKGIDKIEIQKSLEIVDKLHFNHNIGYILYNPGTTFEELQQTVSYLLSPEGPTILKLIGMMVLKGTPEETMIREQGLLTERDMKIRYSFIDQKVAAFAELMRRYQSLYEPAAKDYYEIHFMLGDLTEIERTALMERIKFVEVRFRALHQQFLAKAIDQLSQGDLRTSSWITSFTEAFAALHSETQNILQEGARLISSLEGNTSSVI